jgi:hypothetical protein
MGEGDTGLSGESLVEVVAVFAGHKRFSVEPLVQSTEDRANKVEEPPAACPQCGGSHVVRILWDYAHLGTKDQGDIAAERAILAGKASRQVPSWACLTCEPRWSEVHGLACQDHRWQLAKEEAVARQDWDEAVRLRDAQYELRPRLAALVDQLLIQR